MRLRTLLLLVALCAQAASQNAAFPLESVTIEGSSIPRPVVIEIGDLRLGTAIDKAGIEQACARLQESGLFSSVSYRYAPGPQKGFALTLNLVDQSSLVPATIDVPGADDVAAWRWLSARFGRFDRQVPQPEAAQAFLAREIERYLASALRGQNLAVRLETDLQTRRITVSFQPEILPRIQSVAFAGNQAVESSKLAAALKPVVTNAEFTERRFAMAVDLNLRPVYEEHGLYRVQFAPAAPKWSDAGVALTVAITEGAPYRLGKVEIAGDDLPVSAMVSAGKLPTGKLANWKQIENSIREMEKLVKRSGFFEATALPDRSYDDTAHVLDLRIRMPKGPLYRIGQVRFSGLSPDLEGRAKRLWKAKPGDPYDYAYPGEFFQAFSQVVDFRNFSKFDAKTQKGAGEHVVDITVIFESR